MEPEAVDLSYWAITKVVLSAGVVSAVVTVLLNYLNEIRKERQSASFLALQLANQLEDYAGVFSNLLYDNAVAHDSDGHAGKYLSKIQSLDDYPKDENWRFLPLKLTEECFSFRSQIRAAQQYLSEEYDVDSERGTDVHPHLSKELILKALVIAADLRSEYGYPAFSQKDQIRNTLEHAVRVFPDPRQEAG